MLMPAASVDSSSALLPAPVGLQATTVLTPTSVSTLPAVTTSIQPPHSKDTTWTKLFVGGLPYHTTDKSLREHFEVFGDIEEAVVITDRSTGKSRGYGFVIMSTKDAAERACKEPNPIIDGRKANVNLACIGAKPRGNLTASLPLAAAYRPGYPTIIPSQYGQAVHPGAGAAMSPYLQQLYAANPYIHPNILNLASMGAQDPYSANPLLDFYNQYAAAAAAAASYPPGSAAGGYPGGVPVTTSNGLMPSAAGLPSANGIDTSSATATY
jgi:hypothetical protein